MNFIKMIRKFIKILIGGSGSKEIYLAFLFGIVLGFIPGFNLTTIIIISLIILINVNLGTVFIAFLLGEILMYLMAPLTYGIGSSLIHTASLAPFFKSIINTPVLALMGFDNYCLLGGIIIGVIIGLIFAWIFTNTIQTLRKALIVSSENKVINKIAGNIIIKFIIKIIFGKQKNNIKETLDSKSKFIRKSFFYPFVIFIIILIILDLFLISPLAKRIIITNTENLTGAEVNIENLSLSIFRGKLKIEELQLTDSTNPQNNLIYVKQLEAQLNIAELLAKRFVADKAILKGASIDTKRAKPGKVYSQKQLKTPTLILPGLTTDKNNTPSITENILEKIKKSEKYIKTVQKYYVIVSKNLNTLHKSTSTAQKPKKYSRYLNLTATELKEKYPAVLFREISGDSELPYPLDIKILNLSTEPVLVQEPVKIFLTPKSKQTNPHIELTLKTKLESDYIDVRIKELFFNNIKIANTLPSLKSAEAEINIKGSFNSSNLNLPCTVTLNNLQIDKKSYSNINLDSIEKFSIYFNISGKINQINIIPDHNKNTQSIKNILTNGTKKILESNLNNIMKDNDSVKDIKNKVFDIFK